MNDERRPKWPPVIFFTMTALIFGLSLYLMAAGATQTEALAGSDSVNVAAAAAAEAFGDDPRVRVVLKRDVKNRFGKVDVIYRGFENDRLQLDVFILDLDPGYPYRREIAYRTARDGFRLGGVRFELISAGRTKAKLVWIRRG
jgi:hypothetical protein